MSKLSKVTLLFEGDDLNAEKIYKAFLEMLTQHEADKSQYERPINPETVILVTDYLINANVYVSVPGELHSIKRNKTWIVRIPRVKNYSDEFNRQQALKAVAERYGGRMSDLEIIELKLVNYVPVEIPDSMFMNTTLE
ncbi:MAG: hypothetical protein WC479_00795 [Candidatus Izemoplasmatales bacterium]